MKLMNVIIRGFRSIEYMKIPFAGYGHKILVGKNESGKSNILKALRLLDGGIFENNQEKELFEDSSKEAKIIFEFKFDQDEFAACKEAFAEKFFSKNNPKLTNNHVVGSFYDAYFKTVLYLFNIDKDPAWSYWKILQVKMADGWHYVNQNSADHGLTSPNIMADSYIHDSYINEVLSEEQSKQLLNNCTTPAKTLNVSNIFYSIVKNIIGDGPYLPCIYWEYKKEHELPESIPRDEFSQDPSSCHPLRKMFLLAGHKQATIGHAIMEAKKKRPNSLRNLLAHVTDVTNSHIKQNWQEYNNVRISLQENGENIDIGIQDSQNIYNFEQRSDGFRRFVSLLLLMVKTDDSLILLDEPEIGLHPSSAKDLRDVLINLGKNNVVVYATHSISMIDTDNLETNLIVSKENENTSFEEAKEGGISAGEIVYNAIGYSVYNELKKKNVLLEGYTDKKILKMFMRKNKEWREYGICYTGGVKNIRAVASNLELVDREYIVLSDADATSLNHRNNSDIKYCWYTYQDLGSKAVTLEDFYKKDFFKNTTIAMLKKHKVDIGEFEIKENDRVKSLETLLCKKPSADDIIKDIKQECAQATKAQIDSGKLEPVLEKLLQEIKDDKS